MAGVIIFCVVLVLAALGYISFWWLSIFAVPFILFLILFLIIVGAALGSDGNIKVKRNR